MGASRLKKWEAALVMTVIAALLWSVILGGTDCYGWWGVMYPELADGGQAAEVFAASAGGTEIRFHLPELLRALLGR